MKGICGHCGREFKLNAQQKNRVVYKGWAVYCTQLCKIVAFKAKRKRPAPLPNRICPTCGEIFSSTSWYDKKFCSLKCYIESPGFKEHIKAISAKGSAVISKKAGNTPGRIKINCLECGAELSIKPCQLNKKKYCNTTCYRRYMTKRFDRWIASPQTIALPQNFDEFLTLEELPCLVEGCNWRGDNLSLHMNMAHGVQAREFKRAAGFNLRSGIISVPLQEILRSWLRVGYTPGCLDGGRRLPDGRGYISLERKEHCAKARALKLSEGPNPIRQCAECGMVFTQTTPWGKTKFCSIECRNQFHKKKEQEKKYLCQCFVCKRKFMGNRGQKRRFDKGIIVVCSSYCRGHRSGKIARGTWPGDIVHGAQ